MKLLRIVACAMALLLVAAPVALAAPPAAPVPVVETVTATSITVSWPTVAGATSYKVSRGGQLVGTTANTRYTVTGLTPETEYTISVVASNTEGDSTAGTATATTIVGDGLPSSLGLGVNVADLFQGVTLIGTTFWPVIAVMAALGLGFWFLNKTRRIIGGRR